MKQDFANVIFSAKQLLQCAINQPCFHETHIGVGLIFGSTAISTVTLQQVVLQSVSDK